TSISDKIDYLLGENLAGVMFWDMTGDLSRSLIDQGIAGASNAYPHYSLINHIASELELLSPSVP
ncbi:MAG: hypothetical protein R3245_09500, partial [Kiloniellales bacterium]|nr:hypothetical protein [Kiloniellales bacterium]